MARWGSITPLCSAPATFWRILTGHKVSVSQGRYTWRHGQVLKTLAANGYGWGEPTRPNSVSHIRRLDRCREGTPGSTAEPTRDVVGIVSETLMNVGAHLTTPLMYLPSPYKINNENTTTAWILKSHWETERQVLRCAVRYKPDSGKYDGPAMHNPQASWIYNIFSCVTEI